MIKTVTDVNTVLDRVWLMLLFTITGKGSFFNNLTTFL